MNKILFCLVLVGFVCGGMELPPRNTIIEVPAIANKPYRQTTEHELRAILPDELLHDEGVIEEMVIRPEKDKRVRVSMCEITPTHIYGDKNQYHDELQDLAVVTMMRADVGQAIGGSHLPGDNIFVRGMRMGKAHLDAGDIITIVDAQKMIKAILLKTHIPHQACWKFQARCGKLAFDFCNNEDAYENGLNGDQGKLDGVAQRARGIRLAALKGGLVSIGDRVIIERGPAKEKRLAELGLIQKAAELLEKSKAAGAKLEAEDAAKAQMRKNARMRSNHIQNAPNK